MTTEPDARPVGETAEPSPPEYADLCIFLGDCGLTGGQQHRAIELVNALLRDAPVVWVATDKSASVSELSDKPFEMSNGVAFADEDAEVVTIWNHPPLTPPGTVRRYALVPHPEGEETTDGS